MSLADQVAIVTGGGRGIGAACVRALAREGASVVVATPEADERERLVSELRSAGHQAIGTDTDVTNQDQLEIMVNTTIRDLGQIDVLVNNAGVIGPTAPLQDVTRADWESVMDVNVTGLFLATRAVLPQMLKQRSGRVINIASAAGQIGFPLRSPYAASKWAVIGITKTLAHEVANDGILVNAICPGPIDGPRMDAIIAAKAGATSTTQESVRAEIESDTLLGRLIPPEHIGEMAAFLASDKANSITGQTLDVNAGYRV